MIPLYNNGTAIPSHQTQRRRKRTSHPAYFLCLPLYSVFLFLFAAKTQWTDYVPGTSSPKFPPLDKGRKTDQVKKVKNTLFGEANPTSCHMVQLFKFLRYSSTARRVSRRIYSSAYRPLRAHTSTTRRYSEWGSQLVIGMAVGYRGISNNFQ